MLTSTSMDYQSARSAQRVSSKSASSESSCAVQQRSEKSGKTLSRSPQLSSKKQESLRVLIVGINPSSSKRVDPCITLKRLYRWADELGLQFFSFVNCIGRPGPYSQIDIDYQFLLTCTNGYDRIISLGGFPSRALNKLGIDHFIMPHPSGLNRKLNDRTYEKQMLQSCLNYLEK